MWASSTSMNKYEEFFRSMKTCPDKNKICKKNDKCLKNIRRVSLRLFNLMALETNTCKCGHRVPFLCEKHFCAKNKTVCKSFLLSKENYLDEKNYC